MTRGGGLLRNNIRKTGGKVMVPVLNRAGLLGNIIQREEGRGRIYSDTHLGRDKTSIDRRERMHSAH